MGLTGKQEKLVNALLKGLPEKEAYRAAGYRGKEERARALILSPKIQESLRARQEELRRQAEEEGIADAKAVMRELSAIAFCDIGDYLEYYTVFDGEQERLALRFKDSRLVETKNISEISVAKDGKVTFKLYSKERALFKLLDILGIEEDEETEEGQELLSSLRAASQALFGEDGGDEA